MSCITSCYGIQLSSLLQIEQARMPSYYTNPQGPINPEAELDLTNAHLHTLEEVDIPESLEVGLALRWVHLVSTCTMFYPPLDTSRQNVSIQ